MRQQPARSGVSLRRLLSESIVLYADDIRATSCACEAGRVRPGDVYVALDAGSVDGHDFVEQAIDCGAEAILVERPLPQTRVPMCIVPDTRQALGRLCQALAGDPSEAVSCIGVTGTDGKTVTSRLIRAVLLEGRAAVGLLDDSAGQLSGTEHAPGRSPFETSAAGAVRSAPQVAAALGRFAAEGATHAVLEVSSKALSEHVLAGVQLDAACFTNITRAHLDLHNSAAAYRCLKHRLLEYLRPGGICVLNGDDPASLELASRAPGPVLTVSMRGTADITAEVFERNAAEQTFLLNVQSQTVVVRSRRVGDHHVQNCLVAAAVALAAGIDLATIARGIERVDRLAGRLERVGFGDSPRVYLDCCSTPTALVAALEAVRAGGGERLWCVTAVPSSGDEDELARFGGALARLADVAFITSAADEPTREIGLAHVLDGVGPADHVAVARDRAQAIDAAIRSAGPQDAVLIVGAADCAALDRAIATEILSRASRQKQTWPALF